MSSQINNNQNDADYLDGVSPTGSADPIIDGGLQHADAESEDANHVRGGVATDADPRVVAQEQLVHSLLRQIHESGGLAKERRVRRLMKTLQAETTRSSASPTILARLRGPAMRWAVAAMLIFVMTTWVMVLPENPASASLDQMIYEASKQVDRTYRITHVVGERKVPKRDTDMHDGRHYSREEWKKKFEEMRERRRRMAEQHGKQYHGDENVKGAGKHGGEMGGKRDGDDHRRPKNLGYPGHPDSDGRPDHGVHSLDRSDKADRSERPDRRDSRDAPSRTDSFDRTGQRSHLQHREHPKDDRRPDHDATRRGEGAWKNRPGHGDPNRGKKPRPGKGGSRDVRDRVEDGRPHQMPKGPPRSAMLWARGDDQFVLKHEFADGELIIGSDGKTSWVIPPSGPVVVSRDPQRFRVRSHDRVVMPFLNVTTGLETLRQRYDLQLLDPTALPDEAGLGTDRLWTHLVGKRRDGGYQKSHDRSRDGHHGMKHRGPDLMRIWAAPGTGVVQRVELEWNEPANRYGMHGDPRMRSGPKKIVFDLIDENPLPVEGFQHSSHHEAGRDVIQRD